MRTRLAPTPSGQLHLGNAANFVLCWLLARVHGGELVLRIEDTDASRARPEHIEDIFASLRWLGIDWDLGPEAPADRHSPFFQSSPARQARYREILEDWKRRDLLFPCRCTRRDLALSAPQVLHVDDIPELGRPYPGTCSSRHPSDAQPLDAWRLRLPEADDHFEDLWQGPQTLPDLRRCGAPVLARADGCVAYHLAVCADDHDQGIDHALRGSDLLAWTHLHRHLHGLLGSRPPRFGHHRLLGDATGLRLSKSAGSGSLSALRAAGTRPEEVLGQLLPFLHPGHPQTPISLGELLSLGAPHPAPVS